MSYSGKDVERVLALYGTTLLSTRAVAVRCGVGRQSVHDWVQAAGLSRTRNASREIPEEVRLRVVDMYTGGMSTKDIQRVLGIYPSLSTIKQIVRSAGRMRGGTQATSMGELRHGYTYVPERALDVHYRRQRGESYKTISKGTGIPMGSIHALIQRGRRMSRTLAT